MRRDQYPRDDLESWLYMFAEWTFGVLPWHRLGDKDVVGMRKLLLKRGHASIREQFLRDTPPQLAFMLDHVHGMVYHEAVNYDTLFEALQQMAKDIGIDDVAAALVDTAYDWEKCADKKKKLKR